MEKIKPFEPKDDNIYDWLEIFEDKAKLHKVDETNYNTWLKCQIGKSGFAILKNANFTSFSEAKELLKTHLGTRDVAKRSVLELKQLEQKTDENIRQVGARASYLARQAFPETPSHIQEREAITAFIKTQPSNTQFELIKGDCKTMSDVCTLAEILIEAQKATNAKSIFATNTKEWKKGFDELKEEIKKLTVEKSIAQTSTQNTRSNAVTVKERVTTLPNVVQKGTNNNNNNNKGQHKTEDRTTETRSIATLEYTGTNHIDKTTQTEVDRKPTMRDLGMSNLWQQIDNQWCVLGAGEPIIYNNIVELISMEIILYREMDSGLFSAT